MIGGTLVPQWFIKQKGRAMSLVSVFGALSSATFPMINIWLIGNFGWQNGWKFWAAILWIIVTPLFYILIRNKPEDIGLYPDNRQITTHNTGNISFHEEESWTLKEALRSKEFYYVNYITLIPAAIITACVFHQISILGLSGLSPETVALISTVTSLINLPIVLLAGGIADKYPLNKLMALTQAVLLVMVVALYMANSISLVLIYGVLMGIQQGLFGIVRGVVWPEYFGRKNLSTIRGVNMMVGVIGSALGPLPFGFAFDIFGGYTEVLLISIIFPLIGIVIGYLAKKPVKKG